MRKTFLVGLILVVAAAGLIVLGVVFRDALFTFAGLGLDEEGGAKEGQEVINNGLKQQEEENLSDYHAPLEQPLLEEDGKINGGEEQEGTEEQ